VADVDMGGRKWIDKGVLSLNFSNPGRGENLTGEGEKFDRANRGKKGGKLKMRM